MQLEVAEEISCSTNVKFMLNQRFDLKKNIFEDYLTDYNYLEILPTIEVVTKMILVYEDIGIALH